MASITALSSRGQVVLPVSIRKKLGLKTGTQFVVISDDENILLKPVKEPDLSEFRALMDKAKEWAASVGMNEEDIEKAIIESRQVK